MADKNFKTIWQTSSESGLVDIEHYSFLQDLSSKMNQLDKDIKRRNVREKIIGILLIFVFSFIAWSVPYTLSKIAALLTIPYYLYYIYKIESVRKLKNKDFTKPPKQFLLSQKQYLQKEKQLLDSILYWAILPLLPILILFYAGFSMDLESYLWYGGFTLIIFLAVYWVNIYASQNTFNPLLMSLDNMIREFEEKEKPLNKR